AIALTNRRHSDEFVLCPYESRPYAIREPTIGRIWKRISSIHHPPSVLRFQIAIALTNRRQSPTYSCYVRMEAHPYSRFVSGPQVACSFPGMLIMCMDKRSDVIIHRTRHGLPNATASAGISRVTTLPAPMVTLSLITTPGQVTVFPPIQTFSPI